MKKGSRFTMFVLMLCITAIIGGNMVWEAGSEAVGLTMMLAGMAVFITVFVAEITGGKGESNEEN